MSTTSTISSSTMNAAPRSRSTFRVAAIGALAATVVNVALWLGGRAADVSFRVSPLAGPSTMQVGVVEVARPRFSRWPLAGRPWRGPLDVPAGGCTS